MSAGDARPGDAKCDDRDAHAQHEWSVMGKRVRCPGVDVTVARTRRPDYADVRETT